MNTTPDTTSAPVSAEEFPTGYAPQTVWLQITPDALTIEEVKKIPWSEVTWSQHQINSEDVAYVRDDLVEGLKAQLAAVERERDELRAKYLSSHQPLFPQDCDHRGSLFIQSGRGTTGESYERTSVYLCRKCGQFSAFIDKDGVQYTHEFALCTPEMIQAAGQWMRYLERDENQQDSEPRGGGEG